MPSCHVFIAASLDGFIAREDGGLDWLDLVTDPAEDYGYADFIAGIDAIVMGRGTFDAVRGFGVWPYTLPVLVLSSSLHVAPPDSLPEKVHLFQGTPAEVLHHAALRGWQRLYIDGGAVIRAFLRDGLIDDVVLSRIPILLGRGLPLFGDLPRDIRLQHLGTRAFPTGLTQSSYRLLR